MRNVMSWINSCKSSFYVISITAVLYILTCFFFGYLIDLQSENEPSSSLDSNLIRATYPNYRDEEYQFALKIFEEYDASKSEYKSFIGYRRQEFKGEAVNIDQFGFRRSLNHNLNDSIWFLGGSSMWGTGSDDARTIPSYFSKLTGENVLNLGESGFNSFQELLQLQILMSQGYYPKEVVFYDGVNDGYYFCNNDSEERLRHPYTSRWSNLQKDLRGEKEEPEIKSIVNTQAFRQKIVSFLLRPLRYFQSRELAQENRAKQVSITPLSSFKPEKYYLSCDDPKNASEAARITLSSWRFAALILKKYDIPVWFVLQPTATYNPERYSLDYIIDYQKQAIVNEQASYKGYYTALKKDFYSSCEMYDDCSQFIDFSQLFDELNEPLFIDTCHVSPKGNEIVTTVLQAYLRGEQ